MPLLLTYRAKASMLGANSDPRAAGMGSRRTSP
jgi:hypothetical protein